MRPPPPPPPKPATSKKLMTIPEDWDSLQSDSSAQQSANATQRSASPCAAISTASSASKSTSASTAAAAAAAKRNSDDSDESGSESDDSTSNDTSDCDSDSEECSDSSSSTCSSSDSDCSCSGSSCDQNRPAPSTSGVRLGSTHKKSGVGSAGLGSGTKEKASAAAAASPLSYVVAATKSRVVPPPSSPSSSPILRPLPVESIKTEHRNNVISGGSGHSSCAPSSAPQEKHAVLERASGAALPGAKRKSLVAGSGKTVAAGNHLMVSKEVPILPPPPVALLQTIPATSIVFKSEPIYISPAERCFGNGGNRPMPGAVIQSAGCSGGRIAPKLPISKDSGGGGGIFSKPLSPLMPPPPVTTKSASSAALGKRTEFRLRPESDILKQSVVRAAARSKASGGPKKKKSSAPEKVGLQLQKSWLCWNGWSSGLVTSGSGVIKFDFSYVLPTSILQCLNCLDPSCFLLVRYVLPFSSSQMCVCLHY